MKIIIPVLLLLLSGCAFTPKDDTPSAIYSFGFQDIPNSNPTAKQLTINPPKILIADVTSPIWFDSQAIHYRLTYHNPMQLYNYANSRWAASPVAMLTSYIRNRILTETAYTVIKSGDGVQADYELQIELSEFSQVFDAIDSSRAVISLNANLIKRKTRAIIAQQNFSLQQKTSTTDAPGAVRALTEAGEELTKNLVYWLNKEISSNNQ